MMATCPRPDPIADYYDQRERDRKAAWQALQDARARGAAAAEIKRLESAYERAAYVGD
jgi:hypothetical protein